MSRLTTRVVLACLLLWTGSGCAAGASAPGDVQRVYDEASRRWVATMTPIEIDEVKPEAELTMGARVEQVEVDTADGALLTSWVELEFVVTTALTRSTEFTRVQSGKKVETEGEMQLIGQSWPHLNCRSASLRADGAPILLTPSDLEGERAAYEGRVLNEGGRAVALQETVRGRIPPAELQQILTARRSRGDLCGTRFELRERERKDLSSLLAVTGRSPKEPEAVAPAEVAPEEPGTGTEPATRRIRKPVRQRTVVPPKGPQASAPAVVPAQPTVGRRTPSPAPAAAPAPAQPALRAAPAAPRRAVPSRAGSRPVTRGQHSRVVSPAPAAPAAPAAPTATPSAPVATPAATPAPAAPAVPVAAPLDPAAAPASPFGETPAEAPAP